MNFLKKIRGGSSILIGAGAPICARTGLCMTPQAFISLGPEAQECFALYKGLDSAEVSAASSSSPRHRRASTTSLTRARVVVCAARRAAGKGVPPHQVLRARDALGHEPRGLRGGERARSSRGGSGALLDVRRKHVLFTRCAGLRVAEQAPSPTRQQVYNGRQFAWEKEMVLTETCYILEATIKCCA